MERISGKEDENPYDKKLELRLGLPGDEEEERWSNKNSKNLKEKKEGLGYFPCVTHSNISNSGSCKQEQKQGCYTGAGAAPWGYAKESSQLCYSRPDMKNKAFSPPSANTAVLPSTSQKRSAPSPVVGWPPIRSFRKNLASGGAAKQVLDPPASSPVKEAKEKQTEKNNKGLFVKINMDGVPIGRKVDLSAYDSFEKLSSAVDMLFRGLLAAQKDSPACGIDNREEEKAITGLLDGSGEYTLVYEDSEGDRMLAGDVPWHMFLSTVKRLRVLRSSDLSSLSNLQGQRARIESC